MALAVVFTTTTIATTQTVALAASDPQMAAFNGLQQVFIVPLANGTAASTVAPIHEAVETTTTSPAAGTCYQKDATHVSAGDSIPANSIVVVVYNAVGETINPSAN